MKHTLLPLLLFVSALFAGAGCKKSRLEKSDGKTADIWKMAGLREWKTVSSGIVTDIDSNEVRYIAKSYSDTSKTVFAIDVIDDSSIRLRGYLLKISTVDEANRILFFKSDKRENPQAYYDLSISLEYFVMRDSIAIRQDSTFNYDPNTLNFCSAATYIH